MKVKWTNLIFYLLAMGCVLGAAIAFTTQEIVYHYSYTDHWGDRHFTEEVTFPYTNIGVALCIVAVILTMVALFVDFESSSEASKS